MQLKRFLLLWAATFGFWGTVASAVTIFPLYLVHVGIPDKLIGLIAGSAALGGLAGRPLLGRAVDRFGTRPFLLWGAAFWFVTVPLAAWTTSPWVLLAFRMLQGLGGAMFTAAALGFVNYTTPAEQRGAIISWWDTSGSAANLLFPTASALIAGVVGFLPAFAVSGGLGMMAFLFALAMPQAKPSQDARGESHHRSPIFIKTSIPAGFVGAIVGYAVGGLIVLAPLVAVLVGISNAGYMMLAFSVGTLLVRPVMAPLSDRKGRSWVIIPGLIFMGMSVIIIALFGSPLLALAAMLIFGMGTGSAMPGMMAWSVDSAVESERGSAGNTFYAFWEAGIFSGSALQGVLLETFGLLGFLSIAVMLAAAIIGYLAFQRRTTTQVVESPLL